MSRKPVTQGGKREEILNAAEELFFSHGYDGTSIRMIQNKVHSEVGLFYYYFKSKNDILDEVINRHFARYAAGIASILQKGQRDPYRLLFNFFLYVKKKWDEGNKNYKHMHWSMQWAIREHMNSIMEPTVFQILEIMHKEKLIPGDSLPIVSIFLSRGIGSLITRENTELLDNEMEAVRNLILRCLHVTPDEAAQLFPRYPNKEELKCLVETASASMLAVPPQETLVQWVREHQESREILVINNPEKDCEFILTDRKKKTLSLILSSGRADKASLLRLLTSGLAEFPDGSLITANLFLFKPSVQQEMGPILSEAGFAEDKNSPHLYALTMSPHIPLFRKDRKL